MEETYAGRSARVQPLNQLPTMTVAIASHQRRRQLRTLLESLRGHLLDDPALGRGLDVVVVLDGSTDGSRRLVERLRFPVPLEAIWQPNRGLASARNAGLANASGELVWFLDDDLIPDRSAVVRHRGAHSDGEVVVVGPCPIPPDWRGHPSIREFWDTRYAEMAVHPELSRFDHFSAANTSGPVDTFRRVGGFDEKFAGYGAEDYELGLRLLKATVTIRFDAKAIAWHRPRYGVSAVCRRQFSEGRNQIHLATVHPETFDTMFPRYPPHRPYSVFRKLRLQRVPRLFQALAVATIPAAIAEARLSKGRRHLFFDYAVGACFVASVCRHDPDGRFITRVLSLDWPSS